MTIAVLSMLAGLVLLALGGEWLVRGASALARLAGVSPSVIGLTIVAAGTSMPELVVSVGAALRGSPDLAVGNVVGSNLFNVLVILGVCAAFRPLIVATGVVRNEWPWMLGSALALVVFAFDGRVGRLEGLALVAGIVAFVVVLLRAARRAGLPEELDAGAAPTGRRPWLVESARVVAACAGLALGADLLVGGATTMARTAGLDETTIGVAIIGPGTSMPEVFASLVAALRGRADLAIGNVVGSNVFNVLGILGVTAAVHPCAIDPAVLSRDLPWVVGTSAALGVAMWTAARVDRWEGALGLVAYGVYLAVLLG